MTTQPNPARTTLPGEAWDDDTIWMRIMQQAYQANGRDYDIVMNRHDIRDLMKEMRDAWLADRAAAASREAELKRINKELLELNERNCDEALRIKNAGDAAMLLALAGNDLLSAKNARIQQLEAQLSKRHEEWRNEFMKEMTTEILRRLRELPAKEGGDD